METTFQNDPRIIEYVNQIIDINFTICLLTGVYVDVEFKKGCLLITEITSLLIELSTIPSDHLENSLRQLIELQLPDESVINNFPFFHDIMNKMLYEGISKVLVKQEIVNDNTCAEEVTEDVCSLKVFKNPEPLRQVINNIFPDSKVTWNLKIFDQIFIAQVEDILICQKDLHHPVNLQTYTKEGWKVFIYDTENLRYPRRLERILRQFLRSGIKP